jgi:hypothetical protein
LEIVMSIGGILFAALLARRNWKLGRGDRRGALAIAIFMFSMRMAAWVGDVHAVAQSSLLGLFANAAAKAMFNAALIWLLYLALEPALRSRWPHSIVTWNRLLAGRRRDAQVSAHVLIGAALGVTMLTGTAFVDVWNARSTALSTAGGLYLLNGTRTWMAGMLNRLGEGVSYGLILFFVIFCLRTILRNDWIAAIAGAVLFSILQPELSNSPNPGLAFSIYLVLYSILMFALLRFGLVVAVSAMFFLNALNAMSLGTDWTTWYTPAGLATAAVVLGIALLAFKWSLGNADLFGGEQAETPRSLVQQS